MEKYQNDFTTGSISGKMFRFMLPILGALLLQAMYGAVDILIVGRFGSTAGISGVTTGSNIVSTLMFAVAGFATGVTVLLGRYLGEGRPDLISRVIGGAIFFFFLFALALSGFMLGFAPQIAKWMQAPKEALPATIRYIQICGGGMVFTVAYNLISSIFRGLGNSRLPLIFVAIACSVNIIGDLLLVGVFRLDVTGAAAATVFAQAVSVMLSVWIIRKENLLLRVEKKDIGFNEEVRNFVKIGLPISFQDILTETSFLILCAFINRLGLLASSGYGVAGKISSFTFLLPSALMQSMAAFVAQNVGAGKEKRAEQALFTGVGAACAVSIWFAILSATQGAALAGIFTTDAGVIENAKEYLIAFSPEVVLTCILFGFIGFYNGHGQTLFVLIQGIVQTFLVRLPMSYYMSVRPNASLRGIGYAAPCSTAVGILLNIGFFFWLRRKREKSPAAFHNK